MFNRRNNWLLEGMSAVVFFVFASILVLSALPILGNTIRMAYTQSVGYSQPPAVTPPPVLKDQPVVQQQQSQPVVYYVVYVPQQQSPKPAAYYRETNR